jgi:hypothetical protein
MNQFPKCFMEPGIVDLYSLEFYHDSAPEIWPNDNGPALLGIESDHMGKDMEPII